VIYGPTTNKLEGETMKALIVIALAGTALGAFVFSRIASPSAFTQQTNTSAETKRESPLACDRMALTPEVRKRHFEELGPTLVGLRKSVRELPDGYEFEFPNDAKTYQVLTEWAFQERLCCPFFDLDVRMEREGGPLFLRVTGREGVKDFIKVDGREWIRQ
jgi:hypothetical protein